MPVRLISIAAQPSTARTAGPVEIPSANSTAATLPPHEELTSTVAVQRAVLLRHATIVRRRDHTWDPPGTARPPALLWDLTPLSGPGFPLGPCMVGATRESRCLSVRFRISSRSLPRVDGGLMSLLLLWFLLLLVARPPSWIPRSSSDSQEDLDSVK